MVAASMSVAVASPDDHAQQKQISIENVHEQMKVKLDRLAERLEIKASQQSAWEEFSKSLESLEQHTKAPDFNADAAAIARYRAERANEFAKKLTVIADATAKFQKMLTEEQKKVFNQVAHHFFHRKHQWNGENQNSHTPMECHHGFVNKESK